ncbi:hypothetical protein DPMN_127403 [Dreissena polymorpha]|uniref:Uncharacterized protein n=1 Tax=Dreissena polymorpha TaxID=45954 RepID=A0A9D4GXK5_DREPO|nr:hypothetical protein DPMN_127403 [Dreissena polymorpha]
MPHSTKWSYTRAYVNKRNMNSSYELQIGHELVDSSEFDGRGSQSSHRHFKLLTVNVAEILELGILSVSLLYELQRYTSQARRPVSAHHDQPKQVQLPL